MDPSPINILLIEDDIGDADLIRALLDDDKPAFHIQHVERLQSALAYIAASQVDVILMDLSLPDSQGLKTFMDVQRCSSGIPIVVLTGLNDESVALEAVRKGAQDYLVKGQIPSKMLPRILRYAIERHRMQAAIRSLALVDELTGLYNRRGFMTLAEEHLRLARRAGRALLFYFVDLDDLKVINDRLGHAEGDAALIQAAEALKATFRSSDIIARLGGDEFAIAAIEDRPGSSQQVIARLQDTLRGVNQNGPKVYTLGLSVGVARGLPQDTLSLSDLMIQADKALYDQKQSKHAGRKAS